MPSKQNETNAVRGKRRQANCTDGLLEYRNRRGNELINRLSEHEKTKDRLMPLLNRAALAFILAPRNNVDTETICQGIVEHIQRICQQRN